MTAATAQVEPQAQRSLRRRSIYPDLRDRLSGSRLPTKYRSQTRTWNTPARRAALLAMTALGICLPWYASKYTVGVVIVMLLALPGAVGLNALQGVAGQVSAGNAAFMAIGGFSVAALLHSFSHMPFLVNLLLGGVAAAIVGAVVGLPAVRVRGLYLLITTLALQFIVQYAAQYYQEHTVGDAGFLFPIPSIGPWRLDSNRNWYWALLIVGAASLYLFKNWISSRVGRAWIAIREGEEAAAILGVNVNRVKVVAFAATSFVIGVQGVLFAYYTQDIQYQLFTFDLAIQYIAIVIIGGQASVLGTVFGTVFVEGLPYVLQNLAKHVPSGFPGSGVIHNQIFNLQNAIYGSFIMLFLLLAPGGLVQLWERLVARARYWPYRSAPDVDTWR